jgi:hypothetical protein
VRRSSHVRHAPDCTWEQAVPPAAAFAVLRGLAGADQAEFAHICRLETARASRHLTGGGWAVGALTGRRPILRASAGGARPCLALPVTFRAEDSPRGLWRSLGKRVGFTPSRVRIPHPPHLVSTRKRRQDLRGPGGGFEDVVSVLVSVGLWRGPEEPADSARDLMPDGIGYVLVARGHRRRRPAHHAHDCAFRHLKGQEHSCSCVTGRAGVFLARQHASTAPSRRDSPSSA